VEPRPRLPQRVFERTRHCFATRPRICSNPRLHGKHSEQDFVLRKCAEVAQMRGHLFEQDSWTCANAQKLRKCADTFSSRILGLAQMRRF
jgi:hypothetical protein